MEVNKDTQVLKTQQYVNNYISSVRSNLFVELNKIIKSSSVGATC